MGDLPLRTPTYHRLGGPLPRQLSNRTHGHPVPPKILHPKDASRMSYGTLIHVSMGYSPVQGRFHTRYSPVRRSPAEYCYSPMPLDLHVLSLSLAFILSQDQTLHSKNFLIFIFFLSPVIGPLGINSSRTRTCCLFQTFQYLKELRYLCPESGCKDKANYSIPPNNLSSFFQNNFTICHNTLIYTKINITSRQKKTRRTKAPCHFHHSSPPTHAPTAR